MSQQHDLTSAPAKSAGRISGVILNSALGVLLGVALGLFALHWTGASPEALVASLATAEPLRLSLGVAGGFLLACTQAMRSRAVIRGIAPVRFATVLQSRFVGQAANSVLPARLGDLVRIEYVSTVARISRSKLLATSITDLWFDVLGWFLTFCIACLVAPMPDWVLTGMLVMGALIAVLGASQIVLMRRKMKLQPGSVLDRFRQGFDQPELGKLFIKQLWLSPLSWVWESLLIRFTAETFAIDLNFAQAFAVLTAFNISMIAPIPANAGAFEVASTCALTALGAAPDRAAVFSLIYHLTILIPALAVGATIFAMKSRKFKFFGRSGGLS